MSSRTYDSVAHSLDSLRVDEAHGETDSAFGDENDNDEGFVEVDLPEYACTYCGLSDQACVVKCVESGKEISTVTSYLIFPICRQMVLQWTRKYVRLTHHSAPCSI